MSIERNGLQVDSAVEMCTKASEERRFKELGDTKGDEGKYGVAGKAFSSIVDFKRRYTSLSR